ncbi:MAG: DUF5989 family protein [Planctomycetota bacterium]|jgi:hypothetical protein
MQLVNSFKQALDVLKLKTDTIEAVSLDPTALLPGLIILSLAGFLSNLPNSIRLAFAMLVGLPILSFIGVAILFVIAKIFKGRGNYMSLWRPMSHTSVLAWFVGPLGFVPVFGVAIGFVAIIYSFIVNIVILEATQKISRGAAIAVILIPFVPALIIGILIVITEGSALAPFIYTIF